MVPEKSLYTPYPTPQLLSSDMALTTLINKHSHKHEPRLSNISTSAVSSLMLTVNNSLHKSQKTVVKLFCIIKQSPTHKMLLIWVT
jgi:hypothetical protein